MKVAVTAAGPVPDSPLDPRFGRCPYFALADTDDPTTHVTSLPNTGASLGGGAGTRCAQTMIDNGVHVVLTGDCGPKATQALAAAGITVIAGCTGTVEDVIGRFRSGTLRTG